MSKRGLIKNKRLKLFIKNNSFRVAHKVAIRRLKKIMKNSNIQIPKDDGKKIIFNLIYGMYGDIIYWECGLAKALQMRGHDVKALVCGKAFTMCTSEYNIQSVHDDKTCKHCVDFSKDFLDVTGIPYSTYNDYVSDEKIENIKNRVNKLSIEECENLVYKDVNVGALHMNAAMRYFEGDLSPNKDEHEWVLRSELINSIIATDTAEKIVKEEKPDIVVTRHVGYSSWGSFAQYCENKGIRVCYPGEGYKEDTLGFDFNINSITDSNYKKYYEKTRKKKPLNKKEDAELQSFLDNRMKGKSTDTSLYGYSTENVENQFNLDMYEKTYVIFPNVAWDSSLLYAHKGFKDVYEWISHTIKLFKQKPQYQLIVKIHPSEAYVAKSKNTVSDFIVSNFSPLTENIKIIPPVTTISPYSLFSFIDVGLVYNGTVGLEMALHGIPVVAAGLTHYGRKKFTYDISSKKEYEKILFGNLPHLDKQMVQQARMYAYFYFMKGFYSINFLYKKSFLNVGWSIKSPDYFAEGNDASLDRICDYIVNGWIY